jgi:hypothetical protein
MKAFMDWLVELNTNHHAAFAVVTVAVMVCLGLVIGGLIELVFKALGIKYNKIEIKH